MSITHLYAHHERDGAIPLCGRADWDGLTAYDHRNECWECASIAGVPQPAEARYRWLIEMIGPGFHPDTRDYDGYPAGLSQRDIDRIIDDARMNDVDIYGIALDVIHAIDNP
jgi:hypothetical protein